MKVGLKSLLYGAHQFAIHPLFMALAWWRLYGFPWDPRLYIVFFCHDLGYAFCRTMDGPDGELHPVFGANIVYWVCDVFLANWWRLWGPYSYGTKYYDLCVLHSRTLARLMNKPPSKLCAVDKLATALTPWWLYLPLVRLTGEHTEYMENCARAYQEGGKTVSREWAEAALARDDVRWFAGLKTYMADWAYANKG